MDIRKKIEELIVPEPPEPDLKMPADVIKDYVDSITVPDPEDPRDPQEERRVIVPVLKIEF